MKTSNLSLEYEKLQNIYKKLTCRIFRSKKKQVQMERGRDRQTDRQTTCRERAQKSYVKPLINQLMSLQMFALLYQH